MNKLFGFLLVLFIIFNCVLHAQWIQTSGPASSNVYGFVSCPNGSGNSNLFACSPNSGIFLSTNNGASWSQVNNGLTRTDVYSLSVSPDGATIYAGTGGVGIFVSTN